MELRIPGVLLCKAMASWFKKWGLSSLVTSAIVMGTFGTAFAQSDTERAGARAAAQAGLAAYNSARYSEALDLLSRAESIVHALPHLLYMARAADKLGKLVQAREYYLKIGREQLIAGAPPAFIDAQQAAQHELIAIDSRLPYLTVTIDGGRANECKVTMDDREVPSVLIGVPFPLDPGEHAVVASTLDGHRGQPVKVSLGEGKRERISVKIPTASEPAVATATPVAAQAEPGALPAANTTTANSSNALAPAKDQAQKGSSPVLAYTALGVGVVGAVVGTVFVLQRSSKQSDADQAFGDCKTRYCTPAEQDNFLQLDKGAAKAGTISMIGFGVGGAAIAAGLYLLFTADSAKSASLQTRTFVPYVGPTQAGATIRF